MSLHYNADNSYFFVNVKEIFSNKNNKFPSRFCLGSISDEFVYVDSENVSFKRNVYDLSVGYGAIGKSKFSNIHKYFMIKNSI